MLHYDWLHKTDLNEGNDVAKTNNSREYIACHFWFNHGFKFQDFVCNGCHNLMILSLNFSDIAIIIDKSVNYCWVVVALIGAI